MAMKLIRTELHFRSEPKRPRSDTKTKPLTQNVPRAAKNVEAKRPQNALSLTLRPNPYNRAGETLTTTSASWRDVFNECRKGKTFLVSRISIVSNFLNRMSPKK
ncbi:hypothetical protein AVEN_269399-1 [Araneus ventricosus]|uniref:Uncharacterized protein n=1 Tax=Araneus ventricosus TaxID=182803 RepID=A0A4Y2LWT6_ARAVE|nr:hypothetical protein AVEN_269399-1 [Araneus ventricosus]